MFSRFDPNQITAIINVNAQMHSMYSENYNLGVAG